MLLSILAPNSINPQTVFKQCQVLTPLVMKVVVKLWEKGKCQKPAFAHFPQFLFKDESQYFEHLLPHHLTTSRIDTFILGSALCCQY